MIIKKLFILFFSIITAPDNALMLAENKQKHKERFYALLEANRIEEQLVSDPEKKTRKTKTLTNAEEYQQLINEIEIAKNKKSTKTRHEYNLLRSYDVLMIGETKKIIKKKPNEDSEPIYLVPYEQLFDTLHKIHYDIQHKARDNMLPICRRNYINLTVDLINMFVETCQECIMNSKRKKTTGLVAKPILSNDFNSRVQIDLIDMQSLPDGNFKWILVYQDHFSKFIQLRPLIAKTAFEVVQALFDIFTIFGVPQLLQSDNGREFRNQMIDALKSMWPEMKLVNGRARHPQSQGSVERANADIKKMLATWMRENKSLKWSLGIKFVQLKKNHSYHTGSKKSPFKAVFGIETPLGLTSTAIPVEEWSKLGTAKELFDIVGYEYSNEEIDESEKEGKDDFFDIKEYDLENIVEIPTIQPEEEAVEDEHEHLNVEASANRLLGIRDSVRQNQSRQAEKMRLRSKKYLPEVFIGDFVLVPIPEVDQGLTEAPNLICRVIDVDFENNLYELVCEAGVLVDLFSRNMFDLVSNCSLELEFRTDKQVKGIRQAVNELSIGGGQGVLRCNCTGQCITSRCTCKKSKVLCNSRCHGSNNFCKNK